MQLIFVLYLSCQMIRIADIIQSLEQWAPPALQESYDNSGLICGNLHDACTAFLVCLDSTESVIDEAIAKGCNLVIAHHPIVFGSFKKLNGSTYSQRALIKAIKHDIAIYALHTNLDNVHNGVNKVIADKLHIAQPQILRPMLQQLLQLTVYVPHTHAEQVQEALFSAGAGAIGNYSECGFSLKGIGTFMPNENANPFSGQKNVREYADETRIEVILPRYKRADVFKALSVAHPYEEVAHQFCTIENSLQDVGAGMHGMLEMEMETTAFLQKIKSVFGGMLRYTQAIKSHVKHIAWCGGSGSFLLDDAIKTGADVLLTSDFKYHQFFDAEGKIMIVDIGHFENEQFTIEAIYTYLINKFPNFAGSQTGVCTNPVQYL
jgi:dinuclear metal center YbgI/SA1388 family protein